MRYLAYCSFDGTKYCGWQKQAKGISVQSSVEEALGIFFQSKVDIVGCGRTDAGVHGRNYAFHFDADQEFEEHQFIYKLNKLLPKDIAVQSCSQVADEFHSRFSATSRGYIYRIHQYKDPFKNHNSWYFQQIKKADLNFLKEAASAISKLTDFTSFSKTGTDNKTALCRIMECSWVIKENELELHITANRFLRGMVRLVVGACVNVALRKVSLQDLIEAAHDKKALPLILSAPAVGLTFEEVKYL